jgi:tetratricopeptide (TPR) repeat protein
MSQIEEAISCYKTAIKIKPDNAVALANLAAAYKDSGQVCIYI